MITNLINLGKSIKVKVALFFGYNGQNYLGMQYQRDTANTIENTIHKVLCDEGFVLKTNMESLGRIKWSRATRTDKKVHALCNGLSVRLQFDDRYVDDWGNRIIDLDRAVKDINIKLPQDIRIFAMKRVGKAFDVRYNACSRIYNYICPMNLFLSKREFAEGKVLTEFEVENLIRKVNGLASLYLGTHRFHNFTRGYKSDDPSCDRYILGMFPEKMPEQAVSNCLTQFQNQQQRKRHKISFLRFTVIGQSFIYHQIRKMIGLLIKICYQQLEGKQTLQKAFAKERYDGYLAPGEGLYLNRVTFDGYNNRKQEKNLRIVLNQQQENRISNYRAYLQSQIMLKQMTQKVFTNWLQLHDQLPEPQKSQPQNN